MRTRLAAVALTVLATTALTSTVPAQAHDDPSVRHTTLGTIRGLQSAGTQSWLGIPFAEPPVGPLRWRAPVPAKRWHGVRETREYGQSCIQAGSIFSPSPRGPHYALDVRDGLKKPVGSEDCLTLNVFRPANAGRHLPVIVFVHGGSNQVGYSADPIYDGRALAKRANAVVVTVNYRLGVMGWLDLPGRNPGDDESGNFGTLDQLEALRFVNDNAVAFGGDPANVSVMGESAGAVNAWALMLSPRAANLVDKIIPLSGGFQFASPAAGRTYRRVFAAEALDNPRGDVMGKLRDLSAQDVIRAQIRLSPKAGDPPKVFADGRVLPADYHAAVATGEFEDVPVLAGNTLEEGKLFGAAIGAYRQSDYDRFTLQYRFDPDRPGGTRERDLLVDKYLPVDGPGKWNDAAQAMTDLVFTRGTNDSMNSMRAAGNRHLYYYRFGWNQEPKPFDTVYGAVHAIDLPFVFGNFDHSVFDFAFSRQNRPGRRELAELMMDSIRAFAHTGSPQHDGLDGTWQQWPRSVLFDATDRRASAEPR